MRISLQWLSEWIDGPLLTSRNWPAWREALTRAHASPHDAAAHDRLAYDEIFASQVALMLIRQGQGSNATETRWSCAPLPNPAVPADADSTLHRWSLIKNKSGTLGDWTVRWNGASAAFHLVSKAGERHQPQGAAR